MKLSKPASVALTFAIVCGVPVGITELVGMFASCDVTTTIGVIVGVAFGMFYPEMYRAFRGAA